VKRALALAVGLLLLAGCGSSSGDGIRGTPVQMHVSSDVGATFPIDFTCTGSDRSPDVGWQGGPATTKEYVVELTDPDAPGGVFTHWLVYGIESGAETTGSAPISSAFKQGKNDFGKVGYNGPCPPRGSAPHHYTIAVYALDTSLNLARGVDRTTLENAMQPHVIGTGTLEATYSR
jgi:Raf kinase inhibitor-like YbhB/YbcL family protein